MATLVWLSSWSTAWIKPNFAFPVILGIGQFLRCALLSTVSDLL